MKYKIVDIIPREGKHKRHVHHSIMNCVCNIDAFEINEPLFMDFSELEDNIGCIGYTVTTSRVEDIIVEKSMVKVATRNTLYTLKEVNE